eukprot:2291509-Amphidinium_carterae.2
MKLKGQDEDFSPWPQRFYSIIASQQSHPFSLLMFEPHRFMDVQVSSWFPTHWDSVCAIGRGLQGCKVPTEGASRAVSTNSLLHKQLQLVAALGHATQREPSHYTASHLANLLGDPLLGPNAIIFILCFVKRSQTLLVQLSPGKIGEGLP